MARLRGHRTLDTGIPLYVRRACTVGARTFAAGDLFPWRELGLSPRKLHQLWMQRRIAHGRANERTGAEDPTALVTLPDHDAAPPAPASHPEVTVPAGAVLVEGGAIDVTPSATDSKLVAFKMTPGERVDVPSSHGRTKHGRTKHRR